VIGRQLGPYTILAKLGEGGMGEVYTAVDTRLKRQVAIKVLPATVANDEARLARFEQEALATAALNHPNILVVHDIGRDNGRAYVVAELLEGKTLRDVLNDGTPAVAKAIDYATQIAQGLAAAHARCIVHRDLKPENLFVTIDGRVKILDFGLAKVAYTPGGVATETKLAIGTEPGTVMGTVGYMSPEQVRGDAVDARSDLFSLGVVQYELLTGRPAFARDSAADSITAILRDAPEDVSALRPVPPALASVVARCLEKSPALRFQTASDLAFALQTLGTATSSGSVEAQRTAAPSKRSWVRDPRSIVLLGLAAASLTIAVVAWLRAGDREEAFPFRLEMASASDSSGFGATALSPDGRSIVFVRQSSGLPNELYLRRLDQTTAHAIAGTETGADPAFSPDGRSIAFIAHRRTLMKTTLDGSPTVLADIGDMGGGLDWYTENEIVAGSGVMQGLKGLLRFSAAGGSVREFTHVDASNNELSHQWPRVLDDRKTVLFTIWHGASNQAELAAASLAEEGKVTRLGIKAVCALGVVDGQLVYGRSDGVLMAVPFDVTTEKIRGTAVPVQDRVSAGGGNTTGRPMAFLNRAGGLVYRTGEARRRLVWADRNGTTAPAFNEGRAFNKVRLSPDGRQVALVIDTAISSDAWVLDLAAGTLTPVTTTGQTRSVSWSADGRRVFFTSTHGGRAEFWWQPADGSGPPVKAGTPPHNPWWADLSPDRQTVIYNAVYDGSWNIESMSLDTRQDARPFAAAPAAAEVEGRFSPDGAFVAYVSDETGRNEVYVRPFSQAGGRVQISMNGGVGERAGLRPVWSADGREIFFRDGDQMMSATLGRDPSIHVTSRQRLFSGDFQGDFDVSKDGRFLMIQGNPLGPTVVIVPNWLTELRRLTGAK
jgi:serine/threonine-protein kinase